MKKYDDGYEVYDSVSHQVVRRFTAKRKLAARRLRDRLNSGYGAVRYSIRFI